MTDSSSQTLTPQSAAEKPSLVLYRSIYDLPLSKFIEAHLEGNLFALVISGTPTTNELLDAWEEINLQYADTMKNKEYRAMAILQRELRRLEIFYQQLYILISQLKDRYVPQFKKELNRLLRQKYQFNVEDPEGYDRELQNASNRSKGYMIDLKMKRLELEEVQSKIPPGQAADKAFFHSTLLTLENHFKREMDIDKMTVFKFCEQIRRMNEYYDQHKA